MLKIYTEVINNGEKDMLEALNYEVESRKNLLGFLYEKDNINQEAVNRIFKEYQDFFIQYEVAKHAFQESYVKSKYPNVMRWDLNFFTNLLTITVEEKQSYETKD